MIKQKKFTNQRLNPIIGKCEDCKKVKKLTLHSETGNHQPPFIKICWSCHGKRHNRGPSQPKTNKKVQRGTRYGKHKKK